MLDSSLRPPPIIGSFLSISDAKRGIDLTEPSVERLHIYSPSATTHFYLRRHFGLWVLTLCHLGWISAMESISVPWSSSSNQFERTILPFGLSIYLLGHRHYPTTGTQRQNDGHRAQVSCGQCDETNPNDHAAHCQTRGLE